MIVKAGDTHVVQWKANLDLTGFTVRVVAKPRTGEREPVELPSEIADASEGVVSHQLSGTLANGSYDVELEVDTGTEIITFPNYGYSRLTVTPDLD